MGILISICSLGLLSAAERAGYRDIYLGMNAAQAGDAVKNDKFFTGYIRVDSPEGNTGTAVCYIFERPARIILSFNKDFILSSIKIEFQPMQLLSGEKIKEILQDSFRKKYGKFKAEQKDRANLRVVWEGETCRRKISLSGNELQATVTVYIGDSKLIDEDVETPLDTDMEKQKKEAEEDFK